MAVIEVITDPQIEQSEIKEPLQAPQQSEVENAPGNEEYQTKKTGIVAPLIKINNVVLKPEQILNFSLTSEDFLPEVSLTFNDVYHMVSSLDQPKADNELRVQILPPFDNAYKKIDLTFSIDDIETNEDNVLISGIYKLPDLYASRFQSFGEITTYELVEKIVNEIKLGLASNIQETDDKRFIYCLNTNYMDTIKIESRRGGTENQILSCWIDYWNYLNFVDIFERYNAKDKDLMVWTQPSTQPIVDNTKIEAQNQAAVISNNQNLKNTQLYSEKYKIVNETGNNIINGTDRVLTVYNDENKECEDILLQDGDVKNDIFTKFIYMGEQYGSQPTLLNEQCNLMYIQKISTQSIEVILKCPVLGLMRGHRVDFWWYDMNDMTTLVKSDLPTASDLPEEKDEDKNKFETFSLNKMISGQYLIYKTSLEYGSKFKDSQWHYKLTLIRPQDENNTYYQKAESEK